jgi:hypothetical protein
MAVAGMLPPRPDHARAALRFALDLHAAAAAVQATPGGARVRIRVGVHLGPVTAGLVGHVRCRPGLFGVTVNTASRLEAACAPGGVLLSSAAYEACGLPQGAAASRRVELRGAGAVDAYALQAGSPESAAVRGLLDAPSLPHAHTSTAEEEEANADEGAPARVADGDAPDDGAADASRDGDAAERAGSPTGAPRRMRSMSPKRSRSPVRNTSLLRRLNSCAALQHGGGGSCASLSSLARSSRSEVTLSGGGGEEGEEDASAAGTDDTQEAHSERLMRAQTLRHVGIQWLVASASGVSLLIVQLLWLHARGASAAAAATAFVITVTAFARRGALMLRLRTRRALLAPIWVLTGMTCLNFCMFVRNSGVDAGCVAETGSPSACAHASFLSVFVPFANVGWLMAGLPHRLTWWPQLLACAAYAAAALLVAADAAELTSASAAQIIAQAAACAAATPVLLAMVSVPQESVEALLRGLDTCPRPLRPLRDVALDAATRLRARAFGDEILLDARGIAVLTVHLLLILARLTVASNITVAVLRANSAQLSITLFLVLAGSAVTKMRYTNPKALVALRKQMVAASDARLLRTLRDTAANARSEAAILAACAETLAELFPDACGTAAGAFAEGTASDCVAAVEVAGPTDASRAALGDALPPDVGAAAAGRAVLGGAAPRRETSVARVCRDVPGRPALLDSREMPGGVEACPDWAAACAAGLPSSRAFTAPLTAGPVVVGFVQCHFGLYAAADVNVQALREVCDIAGGAIFVRRAFATADGAGGRVPSGAAGGAQAPTPRMDGRASDNGGPAAGAAGGVVIGSSRRSISVMDSRASFGGMMMRDAGAADAPPPKYPANDADAEALRTLDARLAADKAVLQRWSLDAATLNDEELQHLVVAMFHSLGLLRKFHISPTACAAFTADVKAHMTENPFHNFRHVFQARCCRTCGLHLACMHACMHVCMHAHFALHHSRVHPSHLSAGHAHLLALPGRLHPAAAAA